MSQSPIPFALTDLAQLRDLPFDEVIDVRAPAEFAEDHIPGALSLPVLDDAQRAEVGTTYVQQSAFTARKMGAALIARNAAMHLETALADRTGGWQPLVYCWRGGQRSGAFATILAQIGWRVRVIEGGYRSYRRLVVKALYDDDWPGRVVLIDGGTGTAKTALLHKIAQFGGQIIDLEGLAGHMGSLFGKTSAGQPSQKLFETRLAQVLGGIDPSQPVFVEAESNKIGDVLIPPGLWKAMRAAPSVRLNAPMDARARYLVETYHDLTADPARLAQTLESLRPFQGHAQVTAWQALARARDFEPLAQELMTMHYDPRYTKAGAGRRAPLAEMTLADMRPDTLARTAEAIIARVSAETDPVPG